MVCSFCRGAGQGTGLGVHQSKSHCKEFKDKTDEIFRELHEEFYYSTDVLPTRKKAKELATSINKEEWKEYDQDERRRQREAEAEFQEGLSRQADAVRRAEFRELLRRRAEREAIAEARRFEVRQEAEEVKRQGIIRNTHIDRLRAVDNGARLEDYLLIETITYFQSSERRNWQQLDFMQPILRIIQNLQYLHHLLPAAANVQRTLLSSNTTTTTDIKIKTVKEPFESCECPVCMEEFGKTDIMVTACGHKFHTTCMFTHLRKANNCPCCRGVLF